MNGMAAMLKLQLIMPILKQAFFERDTLLVAQEMIGKAIVTRKHALLINEVEAYVGPHDLACHASRGKTSRTRILFGPAGCLYVYFVYGMHWMLNVVTGKNGYPAAILIRGAKEIGANGNLINGPARLTKFLGIDGGKNGREANPKTGVWFEDRGIVFHKNKIKKTSRIGVDYAGPIWSKKPYRFFCDDYINL